MDILRKVTVADLNGNCPDEFCGDIAVRVTNELVSDTPGRPAPD
jgi:hypothetical protein